jgi:hypothetical protein
MSDVVDLFNQDRPVEQKPQIHHDMERAVEQLQGAFPDRMAGFVIVAVDEEGSWTTRSSVRSDGPLGKRMLAGLATMAIQENLVTEKCIDDRIGWLR